MHKLQNGSLFFKILQCANIHCTWSCLVQWIPRKVLVSTFYSGVSRVGVVHYLCSSITFNMRKPITKTQWIEHCNNYPRMMNPSVLEFNVITEVYSVGLELPYIHKCGFPPSPLSKSLSTYRLLYIDIPIQSQVSIQFPKRTKKRTSSLFSSVKLKVHDLKSHGHQWVWYHPGNMQTLLVRAPYSKPATVWYLHRLTESWILLATDT